MQYSTGGLFSDSDSKDGTTLLFGSGEASLLPAKHPHHQIAAGLRPYSHCPHSCHPSRILIVHFSVIQFTFVRNAKLASYRGRTKKRISKQ